VRAYVVIRGPTGETLSLGPGDLVGRSWCASLHVDDPRISEAHALVSLRGGALRLLALRGRFAVNGDVIAEIDLAPGQRVVLAPPDVGFDVLDVVLPAAITALEGDGLPSTPLHGAAGLALRTEPALVAPNAADAVAWLWPGLAGWRLRVEGAPDREIAPGESFTVGDRTFRLVERAAGAIAATHEGLAARSPLHIAVRYETVHVHRADTVPVVLDGLSARLVSELVAFGVPVAWTMMADELWPGIDPLLARKRLDGTLARLRTTLRTGGVRLDLVRANGQGQLELLLEPGDVVEDQQ